MEKMKKQRVSELKVKLEQPFREKEKKQRKTKSRMDPIKHILQTNNRAFNLSDRMNTKLV